MNESEAIFSYSTAEEDCAGYIIPYKGHTGYHALP